MVQDRPIQELTSLPSLFPFQENPSISDRILRSHLYPPIPIWDRRDGEGMRIVWGRHLVERLTELQIHTARIRLFGPEELSIPEAWILWMELEHKEGGWTWKDLEEVYLFLQQEGIRLSELAGSLPSGPEENWHRVEQFIHLPAPLKQWVVEGKVDLKTALRIMHLPGETLQYITPILETLSHSERRIFLRLFFEVFQRDRMDTRESTDLVTRLSESPNPLQSLHRIRYPELHRLEETYHTSIDPVLKGSGIKVSPPPYFEGTRFKVEFSFENSKQLRKKILTLQKLLERIDSLMEKLIHGAP
ncbi:MAG: hypothetical protein Kow009_00650 [Spirochaetales bacterium]